MSSQTSEMPVIHTLPIAISAFTSRSIFVIVTVPHIDRCFYDDRLCQSAVVFLPSSIFTNHARYRTTTFLRPTISNLYGLETYTLGRAPPTPLSTTHGTSFTCFVALPVGYKCNRSALLCHRYASAYSPPPNVGTISEVLTSLSCTD